MLSKKSKEVGIKSTTQIETTIKNPIESILRIFGAFSKGSIEKWLEL